MNNNIFLALHGIGGHARVVLDILSYTSGVIVHSYIVDPGYKASLPSDFPAGIVISDEHGIKRAFQMGADHFICAIGSSYYRNNKYEQAVSIGFHIMNAIHPNSVISRSVCLGKGLVVCAGSIVNPNSIIEDYTVINTKASIGHDCICSAGCSIGPGCILAGGVKVGPCTTIGMGSIIREKVTIGSGSFVGAGSLVLNDIPDNTLAFGSPAKCIRHIEPGEVRYR